MIKINKSHWKSYKFGDIASNISERAEPKETKLDIYVGLEHLDPDCIHIKRRGHPADVIGTKLRVYPGDIIFGKRRAYQRKAAIVDFDGICSAHAMVVRANPKVLLPELLPFFMHSDVFMHRAVDVSEGSLSPTIKWKILAEQEFIAPPLDDQKRIADLLWSIDEAEQKQNVLIDRMHGAKQVFIDNRLFDSKDKYLKLSEIGEDIRGVNFKPGDIMQAKDNDNVVILRANNISNDAINYDDVIFVKKERVNEAQILKAGDFAICMSSGSKILLGKAAEYHQSRDKEIAVGAFCSIYRLENLSAHFDLVKYYFQSGIYRKQVSLLLSGTNINNLKKSDILGLRVPIATNAKECVAKLHKIDNMANLIAEQNKKLKEIKKQLINQIFG